MKSPKIFIAGSIVVLFALLAAARAVYYIQLDNDGMRHCMIGEQIRIRKCYRQPFQFIAKDYAATPDSYGTVPVTETPAPLLPILYALMGGVRPGRYWPAQALNVCTHVIISLCSFIIARRLAGNVAGAAGGIIVAVSYPLLRIAGKFWTESLFTALFMLTIALLQASRQRKARWFYLLGSSIAASAAFTARFIGVAIVPLFLWEAIVSWKRCGIRSAVHTLLLSLPLPLFVIAALATRNFILVGSFRGACYYATGRSWIDAFFYGDSNHLSFAGHIMELLGIYGLCPRAALAAVLLCVPAAALILSHRGRSEFSQLWKNGLDLVLLAAVFYAVAITYSLAGGNQPYSELRYAAPLAPLILIAGVVIMARGWKVIGEKHMRRLANYVLVGCLVLVGVLETKRSLRLLPSKPWGWDYGSEIDSCKWVVSRCKPGEIIVTNAATMVAFFHGIPTMNPPYKARDNLFTPIPTNVEEFLVPRMKEIGSRYLLILKIRDGLPKEFWRYYVPEGKEVLLECEWGKFIAALSRKEPVSDNFTLVYECPMGLVYKLIE